MKMNMMMLKDKMIKNIVFNSIFLVFKIKNLNIIYQNYIINLTNKNILND